MGIDLTLLGQQARAMGTALSAHESTTAQRTQQAMTTYQAQVGEEQRWVHAVDDSRTTATWLLARPLEPFDTVRDVPPIPATYAVAAADGSQIDRDRHGTADWFLINTGRVYLRYGSEPVARLSSQPLLCYEDADLYIRDQRDTSRGIRRVPIEGNYLGVRRDLEELHALRDLVAAYLLDDAATMPVLALADGTLMRWALAGAEDFVQQALLKPYLKALDELRECGVPVVSYISRPRGTEFAGTLRLMFCPDVQPAERKGAKCSACSDIRAGRGRSCDVLDGLLDTDLMGRLLREGQRGPIFQSMSRVNIEEYGPHRIHFFYMRVGRELARIELPQWVAADAMLVDRCHSLVYDQVARGNGYPVALARAHEQAVVRASDRRNCQHLIETHLMRSGMALSRSRKQEKKDQVEL